MSSRYARARRRNGRWSSGRGEPIRSARGRPRATTRSVTAAAAVTRPVASCSDYPRGVIPALIGALAGVLLGVSAAAYWAIGIVAATGAFLAGFEHRDGWGGADRGFFGGLIYGIALLLAHAAAGTEAKVSLGSFPPFLVVITAIAGMFISAAGGRLARAAREHAGIVITTPDADG